MAADTIAGYIDGLLDGKEFKQMTYALQKAAGDEEVPGVEHERLTA